MPRLFLPRTAEDGHGRAGVRRFLGVPYAEPPVGEGRWRPPTPKVIFHDTNSIGD
eukprot:COSAG01_NODE_23_length_37704_cov_30.005877_42_plen_55_part_00